MAVGSAPSATPSAETTRALRDEAATSMAPAFMTSRARRSRLATTRRPAPWPWSASSASRSPAGPLALPALPADVRAMQPILYPQDIESRFPQIFPVLEHEQIDLIRSLGGPPRRFAPGELVVVAGGLPRMFVVLEGSVDVVRNDGL